MAVFLVLPFNIFTVSIILMASAKTSAINPYEIKEIRMSALHAPPLQFCSTKDGNISCFGLGPNIYKWMAEKAKAKLIMVPVNESLRQKYGSVAASLNMLLSGEVDVATPGFDPSKELPAKVDFSFPFGYSQMRILTPRPGEESRIFAVIRPFQLIVWIVLGIALLVMAASFFLVAFVNKRIGMSESAAVTRQDFGRFLFFVMMTMANQDYRIEIFYRNRAHSFRLLASIWLLAAVVLINSFSGILISSLTAPRMKPKINSLQDLADQWELIPAASVGVGLTKIILDAQSGAMKVIGDKMRQYPEGIYKNDETKTALVASMRYALMDNEHYCFFKMGDDYKKTGRCRYSVSSPLSYTMAICFGLQRNGHANRAINYVLLSLLDVGLIDHWFRQTSTTNTQCMGNTERNDARKVAAIKVVDLISAFFVLAVGLAISFVFFAVELASKLKRSRRV